MPVTTVEGRGTLGATQMAGRFQMLNSNDLIWSRMIHNYLMGDRTPMIHMQTDAPGTYVLQP